MTMMMTSCFPIMGLTVCGIGHVALAREHLAGASSHKFPT